MNTALITHTDLDGISVIVLAKLFHVRFKRIYIWNYEQININEMKKHRNILMVDLSIDEKSFTELRHQGYEIIIYDHHESSRYLSKCRGCIWDLNKCGTRLFYDNFIKFQPMYKENKYAEQYVMLVDVFDRWQQNSPLWENALNLQRLFASSENFVNSAINYINRGLVFTPSESTSIMQIMHEEDKAYKEATKEMKIYTDSKGIRYGVMPIKRYVSIISNRALNNNQELTYIIGYFNNGRISIRSKTNFDITTLKGICGHKNAAGGFMNKNEIKDLINGNPIPYN